MCQPRTAAQPAVQTVGLLTTQLLSCAARRLQAALLAAAQRPRQQRNCTLVAPRMASAMACVDFRVAMRNETACSCDLRPYILVTACRLRTSDLAMTLTASCGRQRRSVRQVLYRDDLAAQRELCAALWSCTVTACSDWDARASTQKEGCDIAVLQS